MTALRWAGASAGSLLLHGALLAALAVSFRPEAVPPQSRPEASLDVVATDVRREQAAALPLPADAAPEAAGEEIRLGAEAVSSTFGAAVLPTFRPAAVLAPPSAAVPGLAPPTAVRPVAVPVGAALDPAPAGGSAVPALVADRPAVGPIAAPDRPTSPLSSAGLPAGALPTSGAEPLPDVSAAIAAAVPAALAEGTARPIIEGTGRLVDLETPLAPPAPRADPPSARLTAALAWTGDAATVDPKSLAAAAAFLDPGGSGAAVRDRVSDALRSIDCARLQTAFDPQTGSLELRGHVPEEALRAEVVLALSGEIGGAIPIRDRLRVLPRPQCGLLAMIDAVGLAQSDEQALDPRVIGDDTQVRDYGFVAGDRLVIDVTSPDYPAYVHVDYFDASGTVLHLQPNEIVPAEQVAPDRALTVGGARPDGPSLDLTIGPPFGQEIAVAFATSHPLFVDPRPLSEPADVYLAELRARVAEARIRHPDFKGEWVYFFVSTTDRP